MFSLVHTGIMWYDFCTELHSYKKQRIKKAIEGLLQLPPQGDIKTLQGFSDNRKRLRVGKYRIVYLNCQNGEIEILYIINVDSRGDIYK